MQNCIKTFIAIVLAFPLSIFAQTSPRYELLLKGGHVIDPANHIDDVRDVAVSQGKIAAIEKIFQRTRPARLLTFRSSTSRPDSLTFTTMWVMVARR